MPGLWNRLFRRRDGSAPEPPEPATGAADPAGVIGEDDPRIAAGHTLVDAYWQRIGRPEPDVISHLVNPMFMGGPAWPNTRQAYRVIRTPDSVVIASDGLSDPFVGTSITDANGFGCEVYLETPDFVGADFDAVAGSWAYDLLSNWAQNVAQAGGINDPLAQHGVLSTEFPAASDLPAGWVGEDGSVGLLVGVPAPDRPPWIEDMPFAPVRMIPLTLVGATELQLVRSGGGAARQDLADRLAAAGLHHRSTLRRSALA